MKKHVDQNELITGKKKKKVSIVNVILVFIILVGLSVMLYPSFSNWWNSFHQTRAINAYKEKLAELTDEDYEKLWAQADAYNEALRELGTPYERYGELQEEYEAALDITGTGMMGYVEIESIDVALPIYHGTSDSVLNIAAGHLEGSTLPVGGESTHCVLSAHRGLPSAKLFTDLDELVEGDTFSITVLNQTLTYMVDQILIVEPDQMEALSIEKGKDYVTLMTCTPYGINSHRMFVRGHRISESTDDLVIVSDAIKLSPVIVAFIVGIPILLIFLIILLIHYLLNKGEDLDLIKEALKGLEDLPDELKEDKDEN